MILCGIGIDGRVSERCVRDFKVDEVWSSKLVDLIWESVDSLRGSDLD